MAYLRWSYSNWYVFETVESGYAIDEVTLWIAYCNNGNTTLAYGVLRRFGLERVLDLLKHVLADADASERDWVELKEAISEWAEDVQRNYTVTEVKVKLLKSLGVSPDDLEYVALRPARPCKRGHSRERRCKRCGSPIPAQVSNFGYLVWKKRKEARWNKVPLCRKCYVEVWQMEVS